MSNCKKTFFLQDSENPVRICCVVVPTDAKLGQYSSNPFEVDLIFLKAFLLVSFIITYEE